MYFTSGLKATVTSYQFLLSKLDGQLQPSKVSPARSRVDMSVMYEVQGRHDAYNACQMLWLDVPRKEDPPAPTSARFHLLFLTLLPAPSSINNQRTIIRVNIATRTDYKGSPHLLSVIQEHDGVLKVAMNEHI